MVALAVVNYSSFVTPELFKFCWSISGLMASVTTLGLGISCFALIVRLAAIGEIKRWREQLYMFLPFFICLLLGLFLAERVRLDAIKRIEVKANIVNDAVDRFYSANGRLPVKLRDLCPKYLSEIPDTGLGAAPKFTCVPLSFDLKFQDGRQKRSWAVMVEHPGLGMEGASIRSSDTQ